MDIPFPSPTRQGRLKVALTEEDRTWVPSEDHLAAARVALTVVRSDDRVQTADTVPWDDEVWLRLLPMASHFARIWALRRPHERSSLGQPRRAADHYLVLLKKKLLEDLFSTLGEVILDHLRKPEDVQDLIHRAAVRMLPSAKQFIDLFRPTMTDPASYRPPPQSGRAITAG